MRIDVFTLTPHAYAWMTEQRPIAGVLGGELELRLFNYRDTTPLRAGQVDDEVVDAVPEAGDPLQGAARQVDDRQRARLWDQVVGVGGGEQVLGAAGQAADAQVHLPPGEPQPARIELFGDVVDAIRRFDPTTQRSTAKVQSLTVVPAREVVPGSVGPSAPDTECKIVDVATGKELGRNEDGEIWIRGPQVMKGYLNNPDATRASIDSDGFFHTGDIGHIDEHDQYFIVDRLKELIKYKGFQVAPAELEALLLSHPKIADVAVIGVRDEEGEEVPKAFVVLKEPASPEEIMEFVAARVAPHKKVRRVEIVEQIPKSATGKILRRVLRDKEKAGAV